MCLYLVDCCIQKRLETKDCTASQDKDSHYWPSGGIQEIFILAFLYFIPYNSVSFALAVEHCSVCFFRRIINEIPRAQSEAQKTTDSHIHKTQSRNTLLLQFPEIDLKQVIILTDCSDGSQVGVVSYINKMLFISSTFSLTNSNLLLIMIILLLYFVIFKRHPFWF